MSNSSRLEGDTIDADLAGPLFDDGIDLQTGRLIVWGVYNQQLSRVLMYLRARGLSFDKDKVYRKVKKLRYHWLLDAPRSVCSRCPLCGDFLPESDEDLCECYLRAVPGVYIEPTPFAIEQEKLSFPKDWHNRLQSVYICSNTDCQKLNDVSLGVVASDLRKIQTRYEQQLAQYNAAVARGLQAIAPREPTWRPKTKCQACYQQELRTGKRPSAPPPRINTQPRESVAPASLILSIPPTAES